MMHRRTLLRLFGLGAVASALPNIPVAAVAKSATKHTPMAALAAEFEFQDSLYIVAYTRGSKGERYQHRMPAAMRYRDGPKPWQTRLVIEFTASFTGTVQSVEIMHGGNTLVTLDREIFDTNWVLGQSVCVSIGMEAA